MLAICQATRIEKDEVFLIFIVTQIAFWTSNWSEHHTGILRTKVGQFGVTEGEYTLVIVHFLTGLFGQDFWRVTAADFLPASLLAHKETHPLLNHILTSDLGTVIIHGFAISISIMIVYMILRTLYVAQDRTQAIGEFFSICLLAVMELTWSTFTIYELYNGVILTNFGIIASFLISKMIICSVTKVPLPNLDAFQLLPQ